MLFTQPARLFTQAEIDAAVALLSLSYINIAGLKNNFQQQIYHFVPETDKYGELQSSSARTQFAKFVLVAYINGAAIYTACSN